MWCGPPLQLESSMRQAAYVVFITAPTSLWGLQGKPFADVLVLH